LFSFADQVWECKSTALTMMRLRSVGVFAVVGLVCACSGEATPNWSPPDSSASGDVGGNNQVAPVGTGGPSGTSTVAPSLPGSGGVNPATSAPPGTGTGTGTGVNPVAPSDLTEQSGYTPVLNGDGSIARPMW